MLVPSNSCTFPFHQDFYASFTAGTRSFASKCRSLSPLGLQKQHQVLHQRSKFRLSVCGNSLSAKRRDRKVIATTNSQTKWYVKQPTYRYWGEEKKDGIIYSVYLKKVRYHRPTRSLSSPNSDSDDERSHLEWETVKVRYVKAATLPRLIESIVTDDGELDSTHLNIFLATYRSFSTPGEVLQLLLHHYEEMPTVVENGKVDQHRKELRSALNIWLNNYPEDFRSPGTNHPVLRTLLAFCERHLPATELHAKLRHRLEKYEREAAGIGNNGDVGGVVMGGRGGGGGGVGVGGGLYGECRPTGLVYRPVVSEGRGYRLPHVDVKEFAEQLTRIDVALFLSLVPYQCTATHWERREQHPLAVHSVTATVTQFNALLTRVQYTILCDPALRPPDRAALIACWVDVAQQLRVLKNFSSLKAIISALQSNPVHRLERTWAAVGREKMEVYKELAGIFSEEGNHRMQRLVMMREGTAKFADTVGEGDKQMQKVLQRQNNNVSVGTIPYLGTYLTDLIMIDKASSDHVSDHNLINFDKRRKEFDVLAQIKLLQGAAKAYNLNLDPKIHDWLDANLMLHDKQLDKLSTAIEPSANSVNSANGGGATGSHCAAKTLKKREKRTTSATTTGISGHKKNDSIASNSSSNSSQFYLEVDSVPSSPGNSIDRDRKMSSPSQLSRNSSVTGNNPAAGCHSNSSSSSSLLSLDVSLTSSHSGGVATNKISSKSNSKHCKPTAKPATNYSDKLSNSVGKVSNNSVASDNVPNVYVIKVRYEDQPLSGNGVSEGICGGVAPTSAVDGVESVVMYKSIYLSDSERTPQVVRNAMGKFGLEGSADEYTLAQLLPGKEMVLPPTQNVYYAIKADLELNFILRPKTSSKHVESSGKPSKQKNKS